MRNPDTECKTRPAPDPRRGSPVQAVRDAGVLLFLIALALTVRIDLPGKVVEGPRTHAAGEIAGTTPAPAGDPVDVSEEVTIESPPDASTPAFLQRRLPGKAGAAGCSDRAPALETLETLETLES